MSSIGADLNEAFTVQNFTNTEQYPVLSVLNPLLQDYTTSIDNNADVLNSMSTTEIEMQKCYDCEFEKKFNDLFAKKMDLFLKEFERQYNASSMFSFGTSIPAIGMEIFKTINQVNSCSHLTTDVPVVCTDLSNPLNSTGLMSTSSSGLSDTSHSDTEKVVETKDNETVNTLVNDVRDTSDQTTVQHVSEQTKDTINEIKEHYEFANQNNLKKTYEEAKLAFNKFNSDRDALVGKTYAEILERKRLNNAELNS